MAKDTTGVYNTQKRKLQHYVRYVPKATENGLIDRFQVYTLRWADGSFMGKLVPGGRVVRGETSLLCDAELMVLELNNKEYEVEIPPTNDQA